MQYHSKHIFTFVIIVVLCVIALILWVGVRHASIEMPFASTGDELGSNASVIFKEPDGSFSFSMSADIHYSTSNASDGKGGKVETDIFNGGTEERNFVLRIVPWNSPDPITPAFVQSDLSSTLSDLGVVSVDGASGVSFVAADPSLGLKSHEIWFSRGQKLYQMTTYPSFADELVNIISTWKWEHI